MRSGISTAANFKAVLRARTEKERFAKFTQVFRPS